MVVWSLWLEDYLLQRIIIDIWSCLLFNNRTITSFILMSNKEGVWLAKDHRGSFPNAPDSVGGSRWGKREAPVVHPQESSLKGRFLTCELPTALQSFRPQIGNPFISSRKKIKGGSWDTAGHLGLVFYEQKGPRSCTEERPLETPT